MHDECDGAGNMHTRREKHTLERLCSLEATDYLIHPDKLHVRRRDVQPRGDDDNDDFVRVFNWDVALKHSEWNHTVKPDKVLLFISTLTVIYVWRQQEQQHVLTGVGLQPQCIWFIALSLFSVAERKSFAECHRRPQRRLFGCSWIKTTSSVSSRCSQGLSLFTTAGQTSNIVRVCDITTARNDHINININSKNNKRIERLIQFGGIISSAAAAAASVLFPVFALLGRERPRWTANTTLQWLFPGCKKEKEKREPELKIVAQLRSEMHGAVGLLLKWACSSQKHL